MKAKFFCIILILMLFTSAIIIPISADKNSEKNDIIKKGSITVVLEPEEFEIEKYNSDYFEIIMDNYGSNLCEGEPMLPMKTFFIGMPPGSTVSSIEILKDESEAITGNYLIRPSPSFFSLNNVENNRVIENEIYSSSKPYPEIFCEHMGMTQMRKYYITKINFSPFTYIPSSESLVLHKKVTIKLNYEIIEEVPDDLLADTVFDDLASELIYNFEDIKNMYSSPFSKPLLQPYDYVIITTSALQSSLNGFVNFKQSIGHNVNMVTTSWISSTYTGNDIQHKIRNFLSANYASWGIQYVLIVGSHSSIPMRMCYPDDNNPSNDGKHDILTDYYYADLTGSWDSDTDGLYGERNDDAYDLTPEVIVGRIPIDNPTTISSICSKIQSFQQTPNSGWKKNALLLGCVLNYANEDGGSQARTDGADLMEQCKNNILSGYSITTMYESAGLSPTSPGIYPCSMPLTNANVLNQWGGSSGWGIVSWNGHGSSTRVAREVWSTDDGDLIPETVFPNNEMSWPTMIRNTDSTSLNDNKPPIVFGTSCNTAHPETSNNLGAALLTQGASAYIGSTRIAWGTVGWTNPTMGGINSISYYFVNNLVTNSQDCGNALYNSKVYYWNNFNYGTWGWRVNANMYDFNLYGDPAGSIGSSLTYTTSTTDLDNDNVKYGWDWNDGSPIEWTSFYASGTPVNTPHTFGVPGTYNIKVKAEDTVGAQSGFSTSYSVVITGTNNAPNGSIGSSLTYTTSTTDLDNDNVKYGWDWNDGSPIEWTSFSVSGTPVNTPHTYTLPGTYNIKVKAEDTVGAQSGFSTTYSVVITGPNSPPNTPGAPSGPNTGNVGSSYQFTFSTTDPDNDNVKYGIDWDDGTPIQWTGFTPSGTPAQRSHIWGSSGTYNIKVKAEDINGAQSSYSPPHSIVISGTNNPPNVPDRPIGPASGLPGVCYTFSTIGTDPDGDKLKYGWDWDGDHTIDEWDDNNGNYYDSNTQVFITHEWVATGIYNIFIKAEDEHGAQHIWFSQPLTIFIFQNSPPSTPQQPSGPATGKTNTEYTYTTTTIDIEGDQIYYWFDWGDNTNSGWVGPFNSGQTGSAKHTYSQDGNYEIKVKARDTNFDESDWSAPKSVSMPRNKILNTRPFGFILAFGTSVDVQLEPGEDYVDLEILNKKFYIWDQEMITFNPGVFLRLYEAKGLFTPALPFCIGICSDYAMIG